MKKSLLAFCLMVSACASKELPVSGRLVSKTSSANMTATAQVINEYSDDYNILLQINFQSHDGRWVRVEKAELDLSSSDGAPFNIIVGKDLVTWAEAKAEEKRMKTHNQSVTTMGVALAGGALAIAGILSDSKELTAAGAATYAGAAGYSTYAGYKEMQGNAQGVKQVPETHLYSPFSVPSMALVKRWVLVNAPTGRIGRIAKLKLTTVEGETFTYHLNLTPSVAN